MPSMNSEFVMIAPASDAFTRSIMPARSAVIAITSSVRLPERRVQEPADGVARPGSRRFRSLGSAAASGTIASTGENEEQRVRIGGRVLEDEHDGHDDQEPQDPVLAKFLNQRVHGALLPLYCRRRYPCRRLPCAPSARRAESTGNPAVAPGSAKMQRR